jgi:hypothetical protein
MPPSICSASFPGDAVAVVERPFIDEAAASVREATVIAVESILGWEERGGVRFELERAREELIG